MDHRSGSGGRRGGLWGRVVLVLEGGYSSARAAGCCVAARPFPHGRQKGLKKRWRRSRSRRSRRRRLYGKTHTNQGTWNDGRCPEVEMGLMWRGMDRMEEW